MNEATQVLTPSSLEILASINQALSVPFWKKADFWISMAVSVVGLVYSWKAFGEAGKARKAAKQAGAAVKVQTITIELTEVTQQLDRLHSKIRFDEVRNMLSDASRRIRRVIAPYEKDQILQQPIEKLKAALDAAKRNLNSVRPSHPEQQSETPFVVYNAIESDFSSIIALLVDLLGLFEQMAMDRGEK